MDYSTQFYVLSPCIYILLGQRLGIGLPATHTASQRRVVHDTPPPEKRAVEPSCEYPERQM